MLDMGSAGTPFTWLQKLLFNLIRFLLTHFKRINRSILAVVWETLWSRQAKPRYIPFLRVGGGLESRLTQNLSLRADYIYTDYRNLSVNGSSSLVNSGGVTQENTRRSSIHLYDHIALLALSYRFCSEPLCDVCLSTRDYCGFYLGGACGGSALEGTLHGSARGSNINDGLNSTLVEAPSQLFNNQFQGAVYFGYAYPLERLYLGAEAFIAAATDTSMDFNQNSIFNNTSIFFWSTRSRASLATSTCQYGVDLRPGIFLTPLTLLYSRVGVAAAEVKVYPNAEFIGNTPVPSWALSTSDSAKLWKAAFRFGLGLEQLLTSSLHLRVDYIFTNIGSVSLNDFASGFDGGGNPVTLESTLSTRFQNHALLVGLSYYFQ